MKERTEPFRKTTFSKKSTLASDHVRICLMMCAQLCRQWCVIVVTVPINKQFSCATNIFQRNGNATQHISLIIIVWYFDSSDIKYDVAEGKLLRLPEWRFFKSLRYVCIVVRRRIVHSKWVNITYSNNQNIQHQTLTVLSA